MFDQNIHIPPPPQVLPEHESKNPYPTEDLYTEDAETEEAVPGRSNRASPPPFSMSPPTGYATTTPTESLVQNTTRKGRAAALIGGCLAALVIIAGFGYVKRPDAPNEIPPPIEVVAQAEIPPAAVPDVPVTIAAAPTVVIPTAEPPAKTDLTPAEPAVVTKAATPDAPAPKEPAPPAPVATTPPPTKTEAAPAAKVTPPPEAPATPKATPPTAAKAVATTAPAVYVPNSVAVSNGSCTARCTLGAASGGKTVVTCPDATWLAAELVPIKGGKLEGCTSAKGLTLK
ncbi:hypothetical protein EBS80_00735 [bacterium]|nr:hypothetical protein [bacterium]